MRLLPVLFIALVVTAPSCGQNSAGRNPTLADSLFDGENIQIREGDGALTKSPLGPQENGRCFGLVEERVKHATDGYVANNAQYFTLGSGRGLQLRMRPDDFEKLDPSSIQKLDQRIGRLEGIAMYFISGGDTPYLLLIGRSDVTSGWGHYYRYHTLVPFDRSKPIMEFDSVGDTPAKIIIDDNGRVYFIRIETKEVGAIKNPRSTSVPLVASFISADDSGRPIATFEITCSNADMIFGN